MKKTFLTVVYTYAQYTPESAEDGEASERGFYEPGGWRFLVEDATAGHPKAVEATDLLRELRRVIGSVAYMQLLPGRLTVASHSYTLDYGTGTDESVTAHVEGPERLLRALCARLESGK